MSQTVQPAAQPHQGASSPYQPTAFERSGRKRGPALAFAVLTWLFAVCVALQVFWAGMAIFAGPTWWARHTSFIHLFEFIPLLMLITAFVGRLPSSAKWLSGALIGLITVQYATANLGIPTLAAVHPVNALIIFGVTLHLATRDIWSGGRSKLHR